MKHINVALFVPDEGCPHRCSFCNQKTISGKTKKLTVEDIDEAVKIASADGDGKGEIAFFGGSFTAIEKSYMVSLLERAKLYIDEGLFEGIRISTRPDCINEEILILLKKYGVTSIELGCQSMNDEVLLLNGRGHTSDDVVKASELIKEYGFEFGVQMMTGLYGDSDETAIKTAEKLIALSPDTVRIYPTVVLEGTRLSELYKAGEYKPQTVEEASELCARLIPMFTEKNIKIIRLGLHSGGNVEEGFVAGAYHPAFKEICESKIYFQNILKEIRRENIPKGDITLTVNKKCVSALVGQKRSNIEKLRSMGYTCRIEQNDTHKKYEVSVRLTK
jgi:histone acetyltransferase (RNA polymerase elongator complex component)